MRYYNRYAHWIIIVFVILGLACNSLTSNNYEYCCNIPSNSFLVGFNEGNAIIYNDRGTLSSINLQDEMIKWSMSFDDNVDVIKITGGYTILFSYEDKLCYCIDNIEGNIISVINTFGNPPYDSTVYNNRFYFYGSNGIDESIHCINIETGSLLWKKTESMKYINGYPFIHKELLFTVDSKKLNISNANNGDHITSMVVEYGIDDVLIHPNTDHPYVYLITYSEKPTQKYRFCNSIYVIDSNNSKIVDIIDIQPAVSIIYCDYTENMFLARVATESDIHTTFLRCVNIENNKTMWEKHFGKCEQIFSTKSIRVCNPYIDVGTRTYVDCLKDSDDTVIYRRLSIRSGSEIFSMRTSINQSKTTYIYGNNYFCIDQQKIYKYINK